MSEFRAGAFQRGEVRAWARRFCPARSSLSILEIDLARLAADGKRLILLDVDNTLLPWKSESIPQSTADWIETGKRTGLQFCILSNTRHPARLEGIAQKLGVEFIRGRFKPNPAMYRQALSRFGFTPDQAVMIGDQIFTDIWGANRAGIEGIWVKPMTSRDFLGTKLSRLGERLVRPAFYRGLSDDRIDSEGEFEGGGTAALHKVPLVRQFVKFAIVGGSSFVIDAGLHFLLMFVFKVNGEPLGDVFGRWLIDEFPQAFGFAKIPSEAAFPVLKVLSTSIAILNSFFWNRRWTFRIKDKHERAVQFRRFVVVSLLGLALNASISGALNNVITGHPKRSWAVATAIATLIVAIWNFSGQKFWAFRQTKAPCDANKASDLN